MSDIELRRSRIKSSSPALNREARHKLADAKQYGDIPPKL
jgi:hypothetical protein